MSTSIKGGEKAILTRLKRTTAGLEVNVRLHPSVEELMKTLSGGAVSPVDLYGRRWLTPTPLAVYEIGPQMSGLHPLGTDLDYSLDHPGNDLLVTNNGGSKVINLSFIRLVGASLEGGVTFVLRIALERHEIVWLGQSIIEAGNSFCRNYVYPIVVSTSNEIGAGNGLQ